MFVYWPLNPVQISVYRGAAHPVVNPHFEPTIKYHGKDGFGDCKLPYPDPATHMAAMTAVLKMIGEVNVYYGTIFLLLLVINDTDDSLIFECTGDPPYSPHEFLSGSLSVPKFRTLPLYSRVPSLCE